MIRDESRYFASPEAHALVLLDECHDSIWEARDVAELNAFTAPDQYSGSKWMAVWSALIDKNFC